MIITRGKINTALKTVIYGPEGIGKTTFASHFPDPVFIDTEGSTKHIDVARTPTPSSWVMLLEQVTYFRDHMMECKTLVIDTLDWAEQLCTAHVCAKSKRDGIEDFGYGKGYTYVAEEFGRLLNLLSEIIDNGTQMVVTAHARPRKFELPEEMGSYDRWEMKLSKNVTSMVKEWADIVLFATYKTFVVKPEESKKGKAQGGKRVMYTSHHPCWDAKNRFGLPDEVDFAYDAIKHLITPVPITAPEYTQEDDKPAITSAITSATATATAEECPPVPEDAPPSEAAAPPVPEELKYTPPAGIPKKLADLMTEKEVSESEIQTVVSRRGYYPADTPINKYDPKFIEGVLISAWAQVFEMIQDIRDTEDLPFIMN